jgi:hypothetical protein
MVRSAWQSLVPILRDRYAAPVSFQSRSCYVERVEITGILVLFRIPKYLLLMDY